MIIECHVKHALHVMQNMCYNSKNIRSWGSVPILLWNMSTASKTNKNKYLFMIHGVCLILKEKLFFPCHTCFNICWQCCWLQQDDWPSHSVCPPAWHPPSQRHPHTSSCPWWIWCCKTTKCPCNAQWSNCCVQHCSTSQWLQVLVWEHEGSWWGKLHFWMITIWIEEKYSLELLWCVK